MPKPALVVVHGIGIHTKPADGKPGSFKQECLDSLNAALQLYESTKNTNIQDSVDVIEINYDHIFEEIRSKMATNQQAISKFLASRASEFPASVWSKIKPDVLDLQLSYSEESFKTTHILDVLLYISYWGGMIRSHVAQMLASVLSHYESTNVHFLGHSLGTTVVHDTLQKMYTGGLDGHKLDASRHRLASVIQLANVSRMVNAVRKVANPYKSIVRPGQAGMCEFFINASHQWDPITFPKKFNPKAGEWVDETTYQIRYREAQFNDISCKFGKDEYSPHSVKQYLYQPEVHVPILNLLGYVIKSEEVKKGLEIYQESTIQGQAKQTWQAFKETLEKYRKGDDASIVDLLKAIKELNEYLKTIQGGSQ